MAHKLRQLGVRNVHVQPLGVDLQRFHPRQRDPQLRRQLGIAEESRLLIFAGRGAKEKNLPVLLDAARRLGWPYHLLLVGSNMPLQVPDNVTVLRRFHDSAEVARLMASADALVHAGDRETFGLVVLEAMASGVPVVAVAAGAFPELIANHCGLLCRPNDGQALARAVCELFEAGPAGLGAQARQHAERHYGWDTVVDGLLQHYRAVLGTQDIPRRAAHG
jgi:alpha-1,6-mannosyltransferase